MTEVTSAPAEVGQQRVRWGCSPAEWWTYTVIEIDPERYGFFVQYPDGWISFLNVDQVERDALVTE